MKPNQVRIEQQRGNRENGEYNGRGKAAFVYAITYCNWTWRLNQQTPSTMLLRCVATPHPTEVRFPSFRSDGFTIVRRKIGKFQLCASCIVTEKHLTLCPALGLVQNNHWHWPSYIPSTKQEYCSSSYVQKHISFNKAETSIKKSLNKDSRSVQCINLIETTDCHYNVRPKYNPNTLPDLAMIWQC